MYASYLCILVNTCVVTQSVVGSKVMLFKHNFNVF